jgi:ribose 5-phosphate isomerase B
MTDSPVAVAADHAGFFLKQQIAEELEQSGYKVLDLGTDSEESVDYPDFGFKMAEAIESGKAERGIIVCGTGIGIAMAANRNRAVRAAVCHDVTSARLAREHNNANVLAMGARLLGAEVAKDCVNVFLATDFGGGRHARRVEKLS